MSGLSGREKADFCRKKRSLYLSYAEKRGLTPGNLIHLDAARSVLEEKKAVSLKPLTSLTGEEFADRPLTAFGQSAFAASVAQMIKTRDELFDGKEKDPHITEIFREPDRVREILNQTIQSFFAACGTDEKGVEIRDRQKRRAGREDFRKNREAYKKLIRQENTFRMREIIDAFRREKGIQEVVRENLPEEDPVFSALCKKYPREAEKHEEAIGRLREASLDALREAAGRRTGREVLFSEIKDLFFDEVMDWDYRCSLREAYLYCFLETDDKIRELAYTREAAISLLKWILCKEPVDGVIYEKCRERFGMEPDVLDPKQTLSELPGYVRTDDIPTRPSSGVLDVEAVFERAQEVGRYVDENPYQFEAQSLLSVAMGAEGLTGCLSKALWIVQEIDRISHTEEFKTLDRERKIRLFLIWARLDAICAAGFVMVDFLARFENKTIEEATAVFKNLLPEISLSRQEHKSRKSMGKILMERSGFHVSEQKYRYLEYLGV